MKVDLKEEFKIIDNGSEYQLPMYEVKDGEGLKQITNDQLSIKFVRGSKLGSENVKKRVGTLHEHMMSMMIHDLETKNEMVPSPETSQVILKLREALHWQRERSVNRIKRGVQETYKK